MTDAPASTHDRADWFEQKGFRFRFGWGPNGLRRLAPGAAVVVIVDVLSFSTSVDVALSRGAIVLPYRWHDGSEEGYADANDAVVAAKQPVDGRLSLRPSSLTEIQSGVRLVLPSPNGSALAFAAADAGAGAVLVGSLRNAGAVGRFVGDVMSGIAGGAIGRAGIEGDGVISVIAAGERWRGSTGPLRPAIEDLLGAGAILAAAADHPGSPGRGAASPEALVAMAAFEEAKADIVDRLSNCGSGRELIARGFGADVTLASALDVSAVVPTLRGPELVDGAV